MSRTKGASEKQSGGTMRDALYRAWFGSEWDKNSFGLDWAKELEIMYVISKERKTFFPNSGRGIGVAERFESVGAFNSRLQELKEELIGCAAEAIETGSATKLRDLADGLETQWKHWRGRYTVDKLRAHFLMLCFNPFSGERSSASWTMPRLKKVLEDFLGREIHERQIWKVCREFNYKFGKPGRPRKNPDNKSTH